MEVWKPIPRLPEYEASSLGRVRRVPYTAAMPKGGVRTYGGKPWYGAWDLVQRRFTIQYKSKTYRVALLVCEAFHGEKPFPEAVAMHLDEDSANNRSENLQWGTQKQNLNFPLYKQRRSAASKKYQEERRVEASAHC